MPGPLALLLRGIREVGLRPTWDSLVHVLRTRWIEARYGGTERPSSALARLRAFLQRLGASPAAFPRVGPVVATPGAFRSLAHHERGPVLTFDRATVRLTVLAPDLIRVGVQPAGADPHTLSGDPRYAIARPDAEWPPCPFEVAEGAGAIEVRTQRLVCAVSRADGRVQFRDREGGQVAAEAAPVGWTASGQVVCRWVAQPDAHFYGLGQRTVGLDRRGAAYVNWNTDPRVYDRGDDPVNLCVPFLLSLHSGGRQGYGFLLENTARSRFDLCQTDPHSQAVAVDEGTLSYSFFHGPALETVLQRYTELTGRVPLFPLWALGYQQCRWSYFPEERVRRLADDFRRTHRVPCDAIHLDIDYMDGFRCFTWDAERFPDPAGLIADLHAQGFRVVTIVDPGIKADRHYRVFAEGLERGFFCRYPDGRAFIGPVWPGNSAFPDFTDPGARDWWGALYGGLVEDGVDGFWNDMNEPALFGEDGATIPGPVRHDLDGRGGDHRQAHNVYGLLMARATAEGLSRLRPDRRPFVLTRSGWAGVQRFAAHWTADNCSTWDSLRLTLPMVLGLGLSGVGFTGSDIGGFSGFASGELYARWLQLGIFLPLCRAHTVFDSPDQEPWSWGEPYLSVNRETIRLRYRLLPYLYTALWQCVRTGMPMVRPLLLAFQHDPGTHTLDDQFLCGDALLVAPALEEGATRRRVYLPAGAWYDFWTDERIEGPAWIERDAPLERVPVLVRAGSVLPLGPPLEYVGQRPAEPLALHVYSPVDGRAGGGVLYEDDGETLSYREGEWRVTRLHLEASRDSLHLSRQVEGPFPGVDRLEVVVHGAPGPPRAVEGLPGAVSGYDSERRILRLTGEAFTRLTLTW